MKISETVFCYLEFGQFEEGAKKFTREVVYISSFDSYLMLVCCHVFSRSLFKEIGRDVY